MALITHLLHSTRLVCQISKLAAYLRGICVRVEPSMDCRSINSNFFFSHYLQLHLTSSVFTTYHGYKSPGIKRNVGNSLHDRGGTNCEI